MDGTIITLKGLSTVCVADAGCHGINLNGFGEEYCFDATIKANGNVQVPGLGIAAVGSRRRAAQKETPGQTTRCAVAGDSVVVMTSRPEKAGNRLEGKTGTTRCFVGGHKPPDGAGRFATVRA